MIDLHDWAHRVPIEQPSRTCGVQRARLVLLRLVDYANTDGTAFPGAATLASTMEGIQRPYVHAALDVLERSGVITNVGRKGRSVRWRFNTAPIPDAAELSSHPDTAHRADVSGQLSGNVSGEVSGHPSTKGRELITPKPPRRRTCAAGHLMAADGTCSGACVVAMPLEPELV